jgi:1-deoxy-D-xylulose-5-phosphate synthase
LPDQFVDHGEQAVILSELGLDASGLAESIRHRFAALLPQRFATMGRQST